MKHAGLNNLEELAGNASLVTAASAFVLYLIRDHIRSHADREAYKRMPSEIRAREAVQLYSGHPKIITLPQIK